MNSNLIDRAYYLFSGYQLNQKLTGCYCGVCLTEEFNHTMHNIPLKEVTGFDLLFYINAVGIVDEKCNDFKYFFPRMLELISNDIKIMEESDFCIFIWNTLLNVEFDKWKSDEISFVIEFFKEYWNETKSIEDPELTNPNLSDIRKFVFEANSF